MSEADIRLLILDVDGVLTDGTILFEDSGQQARRFHIRDGLGISLFKAVGHQVALLTSKRSPATQARAQMLGIELVEQGAEDKLPGFHRLLAAAGVTADQAAYMADDLLDLPVLRRVGFAITVPEAPAEVLAVARLVTTRAGGQGAVREAVEHLLKAQNRWDEAMRAVGADR